MGYKEQANEIRKTVLEMIFNAQTSHIGSNFSAIDILTVLYSNADFKKDKLIVSKGWIAATIYVLGVKHGLMTEEAIDTYCKDGSKFIGLVEPLGYFGCEFAGGSMGYGLPAAVGFALAKKLNNEEGKVYCLMSDGELAIGTTWESALLAAHHELDNLVVIIDKNGHQAMGKTQDILFSSFPFNVGRGWKNAVIDGHNYDEIYQQLFGFEQTHPLVISAVTVKGRGVSFMENNNLYHYKQLTREEFDNGMKELNLSHDINSNGPG